MFSRITTRRPSDERNATVNAMPKASTLTWKTGSNDLAYPLIATVGCGSPTKGGG